MDRNRLTEIYNRAQEIKARTTSYAKEIDPNGLDNTSLGKVENVKTSFDQAKLADEPIEKQQDQAKENKERQSTGLEGTSLERVQNLKSAFDRAKMVKETQNIEREGSLSKSQGSEMVANDAPRLNMNPPNYIRQKPDRQRHNEELALERNRENAKLEEAKDRLDALNEIRQQGPEHDKLNDEKDFD